METPLWSVLEVWNPLIRLNYFSHGISFPTLSFTQSGQIELNAPGGGVFIAMYWGGQIQIRSDQISCSVVSDSL